MSFDVPILLCIFNRPEITARTFAAIAKQKPKTLLIAGDGPRLNHQSDVDLVQQTRQVVQQIDWDCNLQACFLNENLGCRLQMARAISWGFEQAEHLIILEDDCLPNDSFFPYCEEMLERYAEHPEVMMVGGVNNLNVPCINDYVFSKYPLIWGWASWRRAWQHYDLEMLAWNASEVQKKVLDRFTESDWEREYWRTIFNAQAAGEINTWDYSWTFACWKMHGLTALPRLNLVSNIGFGVGATHTIDEHSQLANQKMFPLTIKSHPQIVERDREWDCTARDFYFPVTRKTPVAQTKQLRPSLLGRLMRPSKKIRRAA